MKKLKQDTYLNDAFTPYELYIKFLTEYFGKSVEFDPSAVSDLPKGFKRLSYQVDAVNQGFELLRRHNGFFLADVVGLGKTVVATLIAKKFFYSNGYPGHVSRVLVVVPPAIKENWEETLDKFGLPNYRIITNGSLHKIADPTHYDLVKHTDFTVLVAMDRKSGQCLEMDRFNHLDWPVQKERIIAFYRRYNGLLVLDATGIGDPVYDDLCHVIPRIEPVKLTSVSKSQLIQRLVVAVEQKQIGWPAAWEVLTDELKRYEYQITPSGNITYNAPAGYHDDCVIALALANSERYQFKWSGAIRLVAPAPRAARLRARGRALAG